MTPDVADPDLHELRPAPGVLLRHRGADLDVHPDGPGGPRVELRSGALWIRAVAEGPGVTVTHGAASISLRCGALVVEVHDVEALLVVAAGEAAVKGVSGLPRSVGAGRAVALTLDGTTSEPDLLTAHELAADRMVVENLARDVLASRRPVEVETGSLASTPRIRVRPELLLRSEVVTVRTEPSALEAALANVGVGEVPSRAVEARSEDPLGTILGGPHSDTATGAATGTAIDSATAEATDACAPVPDEPTVATDEASPGGGDQPEEEDDAGGADPAAGRRGLLVVLVVVAMILLAVVAAVVLTGSS